MKIKLILGILLTAVLSIHSLCADCSVITHPEKKESTVNVDRIFFTGGVNKDEQLYINDVKMSPNEIGAFADIFELNDGLNEFLVKTVNCNGDISEDKYIINKSKKSSGIACATKEFSTNPKYHITVKDNVILRSTPVNAGMNRMGYLPKDTCLFVDGFKNEYSRVYLKNNTYGWVLIEEIAPIEEQQEYKPQKMLAEDTYAEGSDIVTRIDLTNNLPYEVVENNDEIILTIYNIDDAENGESIVRTFKKNILTRYSVSEENNSITVKIKNGREIVDSNENKAIKIVIDAGHGGYERGAIGCLGDKEKDLNLIIAQNLKNILEKKGYTVFLTRENDDYISLVDRANIAKDNDALLFVSIHLNSVAINQNPNEHNGTTLYYYNVEAKDLAQNVVDNLSNTLGTKNNGIKQASFAVIRPTEYIGILIETAYMVNPNDTKIYKADGFALESAKGIAGGIEKYLNEKRQ